MRSITHIKGALARTISLPLVKNVIIVLGVVVALLVGFFTLHAGVGTGFRTDGLSLIGPKSSTASIKTIDAETLDVEFQPEVLIYDRNFELILTANPSSISSYEKEHLDRLLRVCDLLLTNDNTAIYRLDK